MGEAAKKFSEHFYPLHAKDLLALKQCAQLVDLDPTVIGDNAPRRRAKTILTDLWTHAPELFFLCSLAINRTRLGTLLAKDYMAAIVQWWKDFAIPNGLSKCIDRYAGNLPTESRGKHQVVLKTSCRSLLEYLLQKFSDQEVEISFPFDGTPLPTARVDRDMKIEMSVETAHRFMYWHDSRAR